LFKNLLFLIVVLFLISAAPEASAEYWAEAPVVSFLQGIFLYVTVLGLIYFQTALLRKSKWINKEALGTLANIELLTFFGFYHFLFVSHRFYPMIPFIGGTETFFALVSVVLYFVGLAVFHAAVYQPRYLFYVPISKSEYVSNQLRFILPFVLPFLLFNFLFDLLSLIPFGFVQDGLNGQGNPIVTGCFFVLVTLVFVSTVLMFFPPIIQWIWACKPIGNPYLRERLQSVCDRAGFKHAGMKVWTVMRQNFTAAIIGVIPRFRYVMFTERLLDDSPPEEVEAVLIHEIGHSKYMHLVKYPFIMMGLVAVTGIFSLLFGDAIFERVALMEFYYDNGIGQALMPIALFLPMAILALLYFRLVFGFFSRNFERQADLHIFSLGYSYSHLVDVLNRVGNIGSNHKEPNWHHHSIQQRIDFLHQAARNPELIDKHHRRVSRYFKGYLLLLIIAILIILSPAIDAIPFAGAVNNQLKASAFTIGSMNDSFRTEVATEIVEREDLAFEGDKKVIVNAVETSLRDYGALRVSGIAELYSAQSLIELQQYDAAFKLLMLAWEKTQFEQQGLAVMMHYQKTSMILLDKTRNIPRYKEASERLSKAMIREVLEESEIPIDDKQ